MRYFLEVSYKGTNYAGFQVQQNANTIQSELERALFTFYRTSFLLTGSSRTDAGVHALQNYFHVDTDKAISQQHLYNINSILPSDIVLKSAQQVQGTAHARFDALSREYKYYIYNTKNAFLNETAWYYPFPLQMDLLEAAAQVMKVNTDFTCFSKKNTQVYTNNCTIETSNWTYENDCLVYNVKANRFLRGMVRALVATMLKAGRGRLKINELENIFTSADQSKVDFSAPAHGLFLASVEYPSTVYIDA
jgi:tRNA pseudouridine38-40 synthase